MPIPALLMRTSMAPFCLVTSAMHAEMLAWEQTSKLTVLMPSSASCFKLSILWYRSHLTFGLALLHVVLERLGMGGAVMQQGKEPCLLAVAKTWKRFSPFWSILLCRA